jgi:hypothetical protein
MRGVNVGKVLVGVMVTASLALGTSLALAASTEAQTSGAATTPAVSQPPATSAAESTGGQKTEKAQAAREKREKEVAAHRTVRGEVTAVESAAKTLTVKTMRNKKEKMVGVDVPDMVKITEGKAAKTLADIKVGDHVWMRYDRMSNKLVADEIHILPPQKTASKKKSS